MLVENNNGTGIKCTSESARYRYDVNDNSFKSCFRSWRHVHDAGLRKQQHMITESLFVHTCLIKKTSQRYIYMYFINTNHFAMQFLIKCFINTGKLSLDIWNTEKSVLWTTLPLFYVYLANSSWESFKDSLPVGYLGARGENIFWVENKHQSFQ